MRRFPWTLDALNGCSLSGFKVIDANGQALAYVYGHADQRDAQIANGLTLDEARRIASNIAKLPALLDKVLPDANETPVPIFSSGRFLAIISSWDQVFSW